eukprot:scaffold10482_cov116-Isochrysis_galbana.AAC.13
MGDPLDYPEVHSQRFLYTMTHLPPSVRDDYTNYVWRCGAWIRNNMTYLDSLLLELYLENDYDYMRFTWLEYHYKHSCRLGVCPNYYLFEQDLFRLSTPPTPTAVKKKTCKT